MPKQMTDISAVHVIFKDIETNAVVDDWWQDGQQVDPPMPMRGDVVQVCSVDYIVRVRRFEVEDIPGDKANLSTRTYTCICLVSRLDAFRRQEVHKGYPTPYDDESEAVQTLSAGQMAAKSLGVWPNP